MVQPVHAFAWCSRCTRPGRKPGTQWCCGSECAEQQTIVLSEHHFLCDSDERGAALSKTQLKATTVLYPLAPFSREVSLLMHNTAIYINGIGFDGVVSQERRAGAGKLGAVTVAGPADWTMILNECYQAQTVELDPPRGQSLAHQLLPGKQEGRDLQGANGLSNSAAMLHTINPGPWGDQLSFYWLAQALQQEPQAPLHPAWLAATNHHSLQQTYLAAPLAPVELPAFAIPLTQPAAFTTPTVGCGPQGRVAVTAPPPAPLRGFGGGNCAQVPMPVLQAAGQGGKGPVGCGRQRHVPIVPAVPTAGAEHSCGVGSQTSVDSNDSQKGYGAKEGETKGSPREFKAEVILLAAQVFDSAKDKPPLQRIPSLTSGSPTSSDGATSHSPTDVADVDTSPSPPPHSCRQSSKRSLHVKAEQRRRNNIKSGFEELQAIMPSSHQAYQSGKVSKATVLSKAVDYLACLLKEKTSLKEEVDRLRREVQQLRCVIMQYQAMGSSPEFSEQAKLYGKMGGTAANGGGTHDTGHMKFYVFCQLVDKLYETFSVCVSLDNAEVFSISLLAWFDQYCNPEYLRDTILKALVALGSRLFTEDSTKRIRRLGGTLNACKDTLVLSLEASKMPYAKSLGQTIDYVGNMCYMSSALHSPAPVTT